MTPLERAARALCELAGNPPGATMDGKPLWMDCLPEVRAVVEAIREPSKPMERAAYGNSRGDPDHTGCVDNPDPLLAYDAMIDALLVEGN